MVMIDVQIVNRSAGRALWISKHFDELGHWNVMLASATSVVRTEYSLHAGCELSAAGNATRIGLDRRRWLAECPHSVAGSQLLIMWPAVSSRASAGVRASYEDAGRPALWIRARSKVVLHAAALHLGLRIAVGDNARSTLILHLSRRQEPLISQHEVVGMTQAAPSRGGKILASVKSARRIRASSCARYGWNLPHINLLLMQCTELVRYGRSLAAIRQALGSLNVHTQNFSSKKSENNQKRTGNESCLPRQPPSNPIRICRQNLSSLQLIRPPALKVVRSVERMGCAVRRGLAGLHRFEALEYVQRVEAVAAVRRYESVTCFRTFNVLLYAYCAML